MDGVPVDYAVKGVVLHGKVVLDAPVPMPDGTLVTVRLYDPGELPGEGDVPESIKDRLYKLYAMVDLQGIKLKVLERAIKGQGGQEAA
ncbi:MAG TPA: hypothetical protein VD866_27075 [Urbifossiella sp.]|nr:hypothetical protein [Urbifossiella sp.]